MKYTSIFFLLTVLTFSSCKKEETETCKTCTMTSEPINGFTQSALDSTGVTLGYADWNSFFNAAVLPPAPTEYCGDVLSVLEAISEANDLDSDSINDYRIYYNCN